MKIALVAHLRFPIGEPFRGGMEMHTHILATELLSQGHEVTLFAHPDSDPALPLYSPDQSAITTLVYDGEEEVSFNVEEANRFHAYLEIMQQISKGDYDLVHNNSLHYLPIAMAATLPCPVVTVLHSPPFPFLRSAGMVTRHEPNHRFIAVSEFVSRIWAPFLDGQCRVVHNGVDPDRWGFSPGAKPKTAVWFGRVCAEKGTVYAIHAARRAGYHLTLAGPLYDREYYDREIVPLLGPDVEMAGHLDHAELSELVGRSEVGLFTATWDEPFGLVMAEILSCGTPLVAFDSGAAREIVTPECGIVVPKRDTDALVAAIPQAAKLSRRACRDRIMDTFTINRMIDGYLENYPLGILS